MKSYQNSKEKHRAIENVKQHLNYYRNKIKINRFRLCHAFYRLFLNVALIYALFVVKH